MISKGKRASFDWPKSRAVKEKEIGVSENQWKKKGWN